MNDHIESVITVAGLESAGFVGPDVSLEVSLEDYGIAWRDRGNEWQFIYRGSNNRWDWAFLNKDLDLREEYDWADFDSLASSMGHPLTGNLPIDVFEMVIYFGADEILGTVHHGFQIYKPI
jgi:hypothetical protein